jgi:signal transduction histidine kinase
LNAGKGIEYCCRAFLRAGAVKVSEHKAVMNTMDKKQDKPDILKQMSSVVSHELRNPLAIISNSIYFIKTKLSAAGPALDPKIAKHIGIIEGEVKHSNEVIEEMLAFTRTREMKPEPLALNSVVKDVAASYAFPPSIAVKTVLDPADPCVSADAEALCYSVRRLLDNSVQAMPEGGTISLEASHDAKQGRISVADSGPGLADCEKAFEPFFTTKPRGIGLGLTIARKYLEQNGGAAAAEKPAGGGAKVTLSLPLAG